MVGQCHLELICLFTLCFTIHGTFQYLIHRNSCRRYALFKVDGKGLKVTGGVIASMQVNSLRDCLKQCLDTSNCKSFNYIATSKGENCQTLSNDKLTGSSFAAAGCNHYEPVAQTVTPGCMLLGPGSACSAGFRCEDSCDANARFKCIDINECESNPCKNGATCLNQINRYVCQCSPGYTGTNCETDINECGSSPCLNSGTCHDHINKYSCTCQPGYVGTRCETDFNECSSSPCVNGICYNYVNRYSCSCHAGYYGSRCQYEYNECASNPCQFGGICYDRVNRFECQCPFARVGTRCECFLFCGKK
ncbi:fibropellin-3-like [Rhopilema esculentum]|uniref:fibropellin-3-like n=1 Tax=Rhopilema esculentum TaxID=499914 RepID=UPI0031DDDC67